MSVLDDREKAFEAKYRMDQETAFRVAIRRDRLVGLWAAERMGLTGDPAQAYALSVVDGEFTAGGVNVAEKILHDLTKAGVDITPHKIQREMDRLTEIAREQIANPPIA